ncbi:hypothetical protein TVAG_128260 [Trichomonas vaginalis G3]|uniref:Uncharacterized protein n=1 Tax=Trichomonas vaginalis (strain ATCC PRA-98 / G3) TaxID=412133 RepID=A2EBI7_TRIV3|nr:armadillo (ARM) repeat-containing protein family [Trichomonas vaginalis G3]EAY10017.1 hypothetical protein TVAG_128260 [Trichomonas vaginalis G3]KAI5535089.1 armadillo (ARM) repeat-containing protein family [Trichomonas vaginalis G3]|eukprot:XP_001322240.1 hypothetical protein [Trichomonas vaginalis G3]
MDDEYKDFAFEIQDKGKFDKEIKCSDTELDPRWLNQDFLKRLDEILKQISNLFDDPENNLQNISDCFMELHSMFTDGASNCFIPKLDIFIDNFMIYHLVEMVKNTDIIGRNLLLMTLNLIFDFTMGDIFYSKQLIEEDYIDYIVHQLQIQQDEIINTNIIYTLNNLVFDCPDAFSENIIEILDNTLYNSRGSETLPIAKFIRLYTYKYPITSFNIQAHIIAIIRYLILLSQEDIDENVGYIYINTLRNSPENMKIHPKVIGIDCVNEFITRITSYNTIEAMHFLYHLINTFPEVLPQLNIDFDDLFDRIDKEDAETSRTIFIILGLILEKMEVEEFDLNYVKFISLINDLLENSSDVDFHFKSDSFYFITVFLSKVAISIFSQINLIEYLKMIENYFENTDENNNFNLKVCCILKVMQPFIDSLNESNQNLKDSFYQTIDIVLESIDDFIEPELDSFRQQFCPNDEN